MVGEAEARAEIVLAGGDDIVRKARLIGSDVFHAGGGVGIGDGLGGVAAVDQLLDR